MGNMCTISKVKRQYAKRYLFHTLAGRWGRGRDLGVGKEGAGLVRGWEEGAPPKKQREGPSCKRETKNETGRPIIPKRYQNDT